MLALILEFNLSFTLTFAVVVYATFAIPILLVAVSVSGISCLIPESTTNVFA